MEQLSSSGRCCLLFSITSQTTFLVFSSIWATNRFPLFVHVFYITLSCYFRLWFGINISTTFSLVLVILAIVHFLTFRFIYCIYHEHLIFSSGQSNRSCNPRIREKNGLLLLLLFRILHLWSGSIHLKNADTLWHCIQTCTYCCMIDKTLNWFSWNFINRRGRF